MHRQRRNSVVTSVAPSLLDRAGFERSRFRKDVAQVDDPKALGHGSSSRIELSFLCYSSPSTAHYKVDETGLDAGDRRIIEPT